MEVEIKTLVEPDGVRRRTRLQTSDNRIRSSDNLSKAKDVKTQSYWIVKNKNKAEGGDKQL
jgi:hypothetical protein